MSEQDDLADRADSSTGRPLLAVVAVLGASLVAWAALAQALQTTEPWTRAVILSLPGLGFGLVVLPELTRHWWARIPLSLAVWGLAFFAAVKLYYPVGGASGACALSALGAGATLTAVALVSNPARLWRNRWIFLVCGLLWVVGGALIGHGVELNLDLPMKRPRPGRTFLLAGVIAWHLPFALLRWRASSRPTRAADTRP